MLTHTKRNIKSVTESIIIAFLLVAVIHMFFELAYVSGESMLPTFEDGEILLVKKWAVPQNEDVVTAYIEELGYVVVKRVIGVEGDSIRITSDAIYRNGEILQKFTDCEIENKAYEVNIPEGYVFLMGDNWEHSIDSRNFGCVSTDDIRGVVVKK